MKASFKQVLSLGLMATVMLPGSCPANAGNDKQSSQAPLATNDKKTSPAATPAGETTSKSAPANAGPYAQVDARMVRLEHRLVEDSTTGRISPAQLEEFHQALDQVAETEVLFRSNPGKFTHWQNISLHTLLDKLSASLSNLERDRDLAPIDLQFLKEDLFHRINLAAKRNRLSPPEVADLKQRFNRLAALEAMLSKTQGRLTYVDKLMLAIDYDNLALRLHHLKSERPLAMPDVAAGSEQMEKRIDEGIKGGKITDAQAKECKQKLAEIRTLKDAASSAHLSVDQIIALGLDMDLLANKIEQIIEPGLNSLDLDTHLKIIDARLSSSLDEGSLNPLETLELKEDLDDIRAARTRATVAGSIKSEDELELRLDIARLEGRLDRQMHDPSRLWPGLSVALVHLSNRNKQALEAKRLSEEDSRDIGQALKELNKKKFEYTKAEGGMTGEQALATAEDLQRLGARLEKSMKDRSMDLPNIDGIKKALDSRIGDYSISGQLNYGDARTILSNLAELNSVKDRYALAGGSLDARSKLALAFELERLSANLEEEMHGHEALFPGVETRRAQIEALINEGISSGRIDAVTADSCKQKLAENSKLEKEYRSDSTGLTGDRAVELVTALEHLWSQLDRDLRQKEVTSSDLVSLEGHIEKKVRQGLSYGLISPAEAEVLRKSCDSVVESFNKMRSDDGGLSYGERLAFLYGFERLSAFIERNLRSTPLELPNLENRRLAVEQKIANLLAAGRLPVQEAQDLKALLDEIALGAAEKHASGGGMSYQEGLIVALELDRLARRVDLRSGELKNPLPDVDELQRAAEKRIEEAKTKGSITPAQYKSYKSNLEHIAASEAEFRISDESLNYAEAMKLMMEIHRLQDQIAISKSKRKQVTTQEKSP